MHHTANAPKPIREFVRLALVAFNERLSRRNSGWRAWPGASIGASGPSGTETPYRLYGPLCESSGGGRSAFAIDRPAATPSMSPSRVDLREWSFPPLARFGPASSTGSIRPYESEASTCLRRGRADGSRAVAEGARADTRQPGGWDLKQRAHHRGDSAGAQRGCRLGLRSQPR